MLYIDHPVEHPTPSGSRAPSPSGPLEPLPIPTKPNSNDDNQKNGNGDALSPVRVPTQAVSDSPLDEKFIPMRPAEIDVENREEKAEAKKQDAKPVEAPERSDTADSGATEKGKNGFASAARLGPGSPIVPNVHAEADEYYGGKEVVNRSRTYSIVSISPWYHTRPLSHPADYDSVVFFAGRCRGSL